MVQWRYQIFASLLHILCLLLSEHIGILPILEARACSLLLTWGHIAHLAIVLRLRLVVISASISNTAVFRLLLGSYRIVSIMSCVTLLRYLLLLTRDFSVVILGLVLVRKRSSLVVLSVFGCCILF